MTIDEKIAHEREEAEKQKSKYDKCPTRMRYNCEMCFHDPKCNECAEKNEQLAEWLEELKAYRASIFSGDMTQAMLKEERNKAIDDFSNSLADDLIWLKRFGDEVYSDVGIDVRMRAEQLKAGVNKDLVR